MFITLMTTVADDRTSTVYEEQKALGTHIITRNKLGREAVAKSVIPNISPVNSTC